MLTYSNTESKPFIFTGTGWETLCTNNISAVTSQDFFVVKNGIPYLPSLTGAPLNPLSGSVYYSTIDKSVMIYNGSSWIKMTELLLGSIADNSGFTSGTSVKTYKLPVINTNPTPTGLVAGALYINSSSKTVKYYDGSKWNDIMCRPIVVTASISNNTSGYSATSGGNVITNGSSNVWLTGVCWSPNANPDTVLTSKTRQPASGLGVGPFASTLNGLFAKHYLSRTGICRKLTRGCLWERCHFHYPSGNTSHHYT
jgi:hypothetical protein